MADDALIENALAELARKREAESMIPTLAQIAEAAGISVAHLLNLEKQRLDKEHEPR